ncbi:MAG: hypothetical protein JNL98_04790 [Bryobacterales bacterium]|nr:hypothetical protein [Bryobacterales bacterium]
MDLRCYNSYADLIARPARSCVRASIATRCIHSWGTLSEPPLAERGMVPVGRPGVNSSHGSPMLQLVCGPDRAARAFLRAGIHRCAMHQLVGTLSASPLAERVMVPVGRPGSE